jgi:phosphohistidine phosphatase
MKVYLVQHAQAEPKEVDPNRPLSEKGTADVERVAALAARLGIELAQIRHSGKLRARQTAEILDQALRPTKAIVKVSGLGPLDNVEPIAEDINSSDEPLMFVGHLPFLSRLVSTLVIGEADRPIVKFHNAGIVCLENSEGGWMISWILTPRTALASSI